MGGREEGKERGGEGGSEGRRRGGFYRMTANSGLGQFASPRGMKPFGRARNRRERRKGQERQK